MENDEKRTTSLGETVRRKRAEKPADLKTVGTLSEEIEEKESRKLSKGEKQAAVLRRLKRAARDNEILWGEVYAVEMSEALRKPVVSVMFSDAQISIPFDEYFEPEFQFGGEGNESDLLKRKLVQARYQLGARVCFTPVSAIEVPYDEETMTGGYIFAAASRRKAMATMRGIWFGPDAKVKKGDRAKAHVLAVREEYAIVECLGIETRINSWYLSDEFVENCQDHVAPGDVMDVSIRELKRRRDGSIYMTVTGQTRERPSMISSVIEGATYLGTVISYNSEKKRYAIRLENGVFALVSQNTVPGNVVLFCGNRVSVVVTEKKDNFVHGKAMKLR